MKDPRTKAGDRRSGARSVHTVDGSTSFLIILAAVVLLSVLVLSACNRAPERDEPDPTALWIVNVQEYRFGDMEPVHIAYELVAEWREWTPEQIEGRRAWLVDTVIMGESGGCWMIFGGTRYNSLGDPCTEPVRWGRYSDAGFGQVTQSLYGRNATVCQRDGICSKHHVVRSAWDSMNAMLAAYEYHGKQPWCWTDWARRYHSCHRAPTI